MKMAESEDKTLLHRQFSSDSELDTTTLSGTLPIPSLTPSSTFKLLGPVGEELITPSSLSVSNSGEIVVSDSESCFIVIYSCQCNYLSHFSTIPRMMFYVFFDTDFYKPHQVAWLSSRRVVFTQPKGSRIIVSDWTGKCHVTIEGRPLYEPYGIMVDQSDNIYVTDKQKGRILCYSCEGKLIQTLGKLGCNNVNLTSPHFIQHSNSEDTFYVNHIMKDKIVISVYNKDGKLKQHLTPKMDLASDGRSLGQFVVLEDDSIVYLDNPDQSNTDIVVLKGKLAIRDGMKNGHVNNTECISKIYKLDYAISAISLTNDRNLIFINSKSKCVHVHSLKMPYTD
ncbi:hypothetical protein FSP39_024225 [Pinctada imbricata]|uniref:Uncharacterized protein n=1 Tax=Pinctada imbricata TaxID=66713 RepID=A0AA88YPU4_PINIB|nr:hypothetical protein FSP39_024225 [Pinctada imbricata]